MKIANSSQITVKATDENLTSENWEYILVRISSLRLTAPPAIDRLHSDLSSIRRPSGFGLSPSSSKSSS
jgi:hypothetical protein